MSKEAQDTMQQLRNRVETKSHGWTAFKAATALGYTAAYDLHKDALKDAEDNHELDNERCWMVFTLLFTLVSAGMGSVVSDSFGRWAGRLIEDAEKASELADELFDKALDSMSDTAKDLIKDSTIKKKAEGGDETRPWTPVVDSPYTYEKKMELMLEKLAVEIMSPLDELVAKSASWEAAAAVAWVSEFEHFCPYMTDLPRDLGPNFIAKVQRTAEWAMWIEWALRRDRPWWQKENNVDLIGSEMALWNPVLNRLQQLGIPVNEITSVQRVGGTAFNRAQRVLDMVKFIDWAKSNEPHRQKTWTRPELTRARNFLKPKLEVRDQLSYFQQR